MKETGSPKLLFEMLDLSPIRPVLWWGLHMDGAGRPVEYNPEWDLRALMLRQLEQIIASSCRQKILLALSETKGTYVTNLVRIINSTYNQVNRNLRLLEKEGIIKTKYYGHMKMIELNRENPKTQALLKALRLLKRPILPQDRNQ